MALVIKKSIKDEAETLLGIQIEAFTEDLKRYEDFKTSPATESVEKVNWRIDNFLHFTIWLNSEIIGGIYVREVGESEFRLNRIFISNAYQNKGLGSRVMKLVEDKFPQTRKWYLDTPKLNPRNHHFYEKLGYKKTGEHQVNKKLTLLDYEKEMI